MNRLKLKRVLKALVLAEGRLEEAALLKAWQEARRRVVC